MGYRAVVRPDHVCHRYSQPISVEASSLEVRLSCSLHTDPLLSLKNHRYFFEKCLHDDQRPAADCAAVGKDRRALLVIIQTEVVV